MLRSALISSLILSYSTKYSFNWSPVVLSTFYNSSAVWRIKNM